MRALLIDDSAFTRRFLESVLEAEGFDTIDEAGTGKEARKHFEEHSYDLILLDIILEDGNGLDLLDAFHEADAETPIVMVSVVDDPDRIDAALERGADGFISKPLQKEELKETLADILHD